MNLTAANKALRATLKAGRKNKYHAKKCTIDGRKFDSHAEGKRYIGLKLLERGGLIRNLCCQVDFGLYAAKDCFNSKETVLEEVATYRADFTYDEWNKDKWEWVVEDKKGFSTDEYKLKKKLMQANYGITIRET